MFAIILSILVMDKASLAAVNVSGTIQGSTISNVWLKFHDTSTNQYYNVIVTNGAFTAENLPDGNYQFDEYFDESTQKYEALTGVFTVSNSTAPDGVVASKPADNVTGTLQKPVNGVLTNVSLGWLNMHALVNNRWENFGTPVNNGQFAIYLKAGTYFVDGYWDQSNQKYVSLSGLAKSFVVTQGSNGPNTTTVSIEEKSANLTGSVTKGSNLVNTGNLNMHKVVTNGPWENFNVEISNGSFEFYLAPGRYQLDGYWDGGLQKYVALGGMDPFDVTETGNQPLQINVPGDNFTGTLKNQGVAVTQAWLNVYKVVNNEWKFFGMSVSGSDGTFSTYLPPGTYTIDGYHDQALNKWVSLRGLGQTIVVATSGNAPVEINTPAENVTGTLKRNSVTVPNANLNLHKVVQGQNGWEGFGIGVTGGTFGLYLPAGTYQIDGYWDNDNQKYVSLEGSAQQFTVTGQENSPVSVPVNAPPDNLTGTLKKTVSGTPTTITNAHINFYDQTQNRGFGIQVDNNGQFSGYVKPGTYKLQGYWDQTLQKYNSLWHLSVTVIVSEAGTSSIDVLVPSSNVTGTLQLDGVNINRASLNFHKVDANPNNWVGLNIDVSNGAFDMYLADATYKIDGYWDQTNNKYVSLNGLNKSFAVSGSSNTAWTINVPGNNFTGTLKDANGNNITRAWLNMHPVNGGQGFNTLVLDGVFGSYLAAGTYRADSYWDEGNQKDVSLGGAAVTFTIPVTGSLVKDIVLNANNVTGTIRKNNVPLQRVNLNINKVENNNWTGFNVGVDNGVFGLYLEPGTYRVEGFWDVVAQKYTSLGSLNKRFTVNANESTIVSIDIPDNNVIGTITKAGVGVVTGSIGLDHVSDWTKNGNLQITNGQIEGYLSPGDYYISWFADERDPLNRIESGLRVLNRTIHVDNTGVTTFDLNIPSDNVTIRFSAKGGVLTQARVYGVRKDNYDAYFSCQTINGIGSCYLPAGEYKITSYDYKNSNNNNYTNIGIEGYDITFTVTANGVVDVSLLIPADNFTGSIKRGGIVIPNATVTFVNTSTDKAFNTNSDSNGDFAIYLPDGTYRIDSYGYFQNNNYNYVSLSGLDQLITVGAGHPDSVNIDVPTATVNGTFSNSVNGWVSVYKIVNGERKMAWAQVTNGSFAFLLSAGTYYVYDLWEINVPLTPENGRTVPLAGLRSSFVVDSAGDGEVTIVMKNDNVTGTLSRNGQPVQYAWINMRNVDNPNEIYNIMVLDGNFSLYVPDGTYKIYKYEGTQHQNPVSLDMTITIRQADPASRVINIEN
jgi:hypothetical protein